MYYLINEKFIFLVKLSGAAFNNPPLVMPRIGPAGFHYLEISRESAIGISKVWEHFINKASKFFGID